MASRRIMTLVGNKKTPKFGFPSLFPDGKDPRLGVRSKIMRDSIEERMRRASDPTTPFVLYSATAPGRPKNVTKAPSKPVRFDSGPQWEDLKKLLPPPGESNADYLKHLEKELILVDRFEAREAQALEEWDCKCAMAAIDFYNRHNSTDYEVVETLGSYNEGAVYAVSFVWHCNFRAEDSCGSKLFFAEIVDDYLKRPHPVVQSCVILDESLIGKHDCMMCPQQIIHPPDGSFTGRREPLEEECVEDIPI